MRTSACQRVTPHNKAEMNVKQVDVNRDNSWRNTKKVPNCVCDAEHVTTMERDITHCLLRRVPKVDLMHVFFRDH